MAGGALRRQRIKKRRPIRAGMTDAAFNSLNQHRFQPPGDLFGLFCRDFLHPVKEQLWGIPVCSSRYPGQR